MKAKEIKKQTPEQEQLMRKVTDEWIAIGLSTEQSTDQQMREAVDLSYHCAELAPPKLCYFFDSPMAGAIAVVLLQQLKPDGETVQPYGAEELAEKVRELRRLEELPPDIKQAASRALTPEGGACYGQHDANWLAYYDYFRRIGVEGLDHLRGLNATAQHCGWWWSMEEIAVVTRKPVELHTDDQNRLHCETGKAIVYADGWGRYCWHGVNVPKNTILEPETTMDQQLDQILQDAETRAAEEPEPTAEKPKWSPEQLQERRDRILRQAQRCVEDLRERRAAQLEQQDAE